MNLGGVDVVSSDVFFAAVKTYWSDAEARLDALHQLTAPFLADRMRALRFAARLASRADPLERSAAAHGRSTLWSEATPADRGHGRNHPARLPCHAQGRGLHDLAAREFALGLALKSVTPDLFEDVLAWAVATEGTSGDYYAGSLEAIDSYLLGATIFRYPSR